MHFEHWTRPKGGPGSQPPNSKHKRSRCGHNPSSSLACRTTQVSCCLKTRARKELHVWAGREACSTLKLFTIHRSQSGPGEAASKAQETYDASPGQLACCNHNASSGCGVCALRTRTRKRCCILVVKLSRPRAGSCKLGQGGSVCVAVRKNACIGSLPKSGRCRQASCGRSLSLLRAGRESRANPRSRLLRQAERAIKR